MNCVVQAQEVIAYKPEQEFASMYDVVIGEDATQEDMYKHVKRAYPDPHDARMAGQAAQTFHNVLCRECPVIHVGIQQHNHGLRSNGHGEDLHDDGVKEIPLSYALTLPDLILESSGAS